MRTIEATQARRKLRELIDAVQHEHENIIICRYGIPVAILVPVDGRAAAVLADEIVADPDKVTGEQTGDALQVKTDGL